VYDSQENKILNVEGINIPIAFDVPDALKYIRSNLLDILREYKIDFAGIRVTEPNAKSFNVQRIQIEGVIQEAFASSFLKGYYVGQISSISRRINIPRDDFKKYIEGALTWTVDGWEELNDAEREALLCAIGACDA
jgi:hypothetical protein